MRTTHRSRRSIPARSTFAGFRFPPDAIVLAVRWYLRFGLSYRDVEELLAERGVAVDQYGQVIDVFVSPRRDAAAARRFFERALGATKITPVEVITDQAATYPVVLEELLPAAWHRTDRYANSSGGRSLGERARFVRTTCPASGRHLSQPCSGSMGPTAEAMPDWSYWDARCCRQSRGQDQSSPGAA